MHRKLFTFFVLNIYTLFSLLAQEQQLKLQVQGKNERETRIIDSISYTKNGNSINELSATVDLLQKALQEIGYVDNTKTPLVKESDSIFSTKFDLGRHFKELKLNIPRTDNLRRYFENLAVEIKNDTIVAETAFAKALLNQLTSEASKNGKPFSVFQISNIRKNNNTLIGNLTIKEDSTRYLDAIKIEGYAKAPKSYLKYYGQLRTGKRFNQELLRKQSEDLNNLPFLSIKKEPEILFTKDSTTLYLYLEKQNNNRFDGFLGFSTDNETNKLRFDGYLDLLLSNNLNYGEQLALNYKSDGNDQQQLKITTKLPYIFKTPLGIELELALFRRDTTFSETNQKALFFYQIGSTIKIEGGYKSRQSENLLEDSNTLNLSDYDFKSALLAFSIQKRTRSNLFPEKYSVRLQSEIGKRTSGITDTDQLIFDIGGQIIFELNKRNQIFLRNRTQLLFSDNYLSNELFRFGGITSIRGFEENTISANTVSVLNTEYRYILGNSLFIHSIVDAAYFENSLINQQENLYSIGFGAGILTKSGLLNLNIANGKSSTQPFKFSNTKIHLKLVIGF